MNLERKSEIQAFHPFTMKKKIQPLKKTMQKTNTVNSEKRNTSYNLLCTITVDLKKNQLPYVLFSWNFRKVEKFKDTYIVQLMKKESNSALLFHKHGEKKNNAKGFCYKKKNSPLTSMKFWKFGGKKRKTLSNVRTIIHQNKQTNKQSSLQKKHYTLNITSVFWQDHTWFPRIRTCYDRFFFKKQLHV